jgi:hypothetical protein
MISRERSLVTTSLWVIAGISLLLGGCLDRKLKPLNPCLVSGVAAEIAIQNIDKIDLLFMVDDSGSMREEQSALRTQFPKLIRVLTSGDRMDGPPTTDFFPATDLHLGVVTSDMGLIDIPDIKFCDGFGDDGVLRHDPSPRITGCSTTYPTFISYKADDGISTPDQAANDFGCIADVGTDGCGFEQQLESVLKALWPSMQPALEPGQMAPPVPLFATDSMGFGGTPHGDVENLGFLRNNATEGLSLIAIIVVTDEEDCSTGDTRIFLPPDYLDPMDPLAAEDLNLRCFFNPQQRYKLDRYLLGFQALRPGNPKLVIFGAITGVPPDLVTPEKLKMVDFDDESQRNKFYDDILNDTRMIETVDPNRTPDQGGNLLPSCDRGENAKAYPPRRIVELARGFGANGIVQSICQDDFGPAMDAIIAVIAKQLGAVCLPRPLVRNAEGIVPCNVVWELPKMGEAPSGTPVACDDARFPYLKTPEGGRDTKSKRGGAVCTVEQLSVVSDGGSGLKTGPSKAGSAEGWFYDTFSDDLKKGCSSTTPQRVAFSNNAKPPTGVTVKLECLNETQNLASSIKDINTAIEQPEIGDACENAVLNGQMVSGDPACWVKLNKGGDDKSMFCHPEFKVCVLSCSSNADCAAGWSCDGLDPERAKVKELAGGRSYCVNPTCGAK